MVISINKIKAVSKVKKKKEKNISVFQLLNKEIKLFRKGLSDKKKEHFFSQLSILLSSGIDLKTSLELYMEELNKESEITSFKVIYDLVIEGGSLFEALSKSKNFSVYDRYTIKVAEETGRLSEVLIEISNYYKKRLDQKKQILSALTYPMIVIITAILAVGFMMKVVVPLFSGIYKRSNLDLPALTQAIIQTADALSNSTIYVLLVIITLSVLHLFLKDKPLYRSILSKLILKLPFVGNIIKLVYLERFFQTLHLLNRSKVPIIESIRLVKEIIRFHPLQIILTNAEKEITQGRSLYQSLGQYDFFRRRTISLIKIGEESNSIDNSFDKIKQQYTSEVDHKLGILLNLLEPVLIIFIGAMVGIILVAMYLPMFQIGNTLG